MAAFVTRLQPMMVAHPSRSSATGAIDNSPGGSYRHWPHTHTGRTSFDHLVGDLLKMQWHVNTKCLGGLDIDHQLELRGLLDRQVGGLLTLENPTGVGSIQTMRIRKTASVAYQAAGLGVLAERKDRSYAVAGSQCCKLFAPT